MNESYLVQLLRSVFPPPFEIKVEHDEHDTEVVFVGDLAIVESYLTERKTYVTSTMGRSYRVFVMTDDGFQVLIGGSDDPISAVKEVMILHVDAALARAVDEVNEAGNMAEFREMAERLQAGEPNN